MNKLPATDTDHLEFYLKHNISPVRQDISDLPKHFDRRGSLYRYLGVPKIFIEQKDILEVGPGSGHNSLYVASCLPGAYDLLEPNPTGQRGIRQLYDEMNIAHTVPNLIKSRLEDFQSGKNYDIVICEAWLGVSDHERKLMRKLGSILRPGGILITTLASPIGWLSNTLRRILADMLVMDTSSFKEKTDILIQAFRSHLDTMQDMTRPYEDWVQDSMINPGFLTMHPTPEMFLETMGGTYSIYNSYPKFNIDWRWYKSLYGKKKGFNGQYLESYFVNCHNFYDYDKLYPQRDPEKNIALENYCFELLFLVSSMEEENAIYYKRIYSVVKQIYVNLSEISANWAHSIEEFMDIFQKEKTTIEQISELKSLKRIFGRELLYVSVIKEG